MTKKAYSAAPKRWLAVLALTAAAVLLMTVGAFAASGISLSEASSLAEDFLSEYYYALHQFEGYDFSPYIQSENPAEARGGFKLSCKNSPPEKRMGLDVKNRQADNIVQIYAPHKPSRLPAGFSKSKIPLLFIRRGTIYAFFIPLGGGISRSLPAQRGSRTCSWRSRRLRRRAFLLSRGLPWRGSCT